MFLLPHIYSINKTPLLSWFLADCGNGLAYPMSCVNVSYVMLAYCD